MHITKRLATTAAVTALLAGGINLTSSADAASLCGTRATGSNGASSDCQPNVAQYTHHIVIICSNFEGGLYEKAGPWVGGYSVSTVYCNRSWDSRHRFFSEGYSEP
jgi:hypothetical protein